MGIEPRDLIEAVKDSAFLESNAENNGIKRKALPSLPHQKKETEENTFDPYVQLIALIFMQFGSMQRNL